MAHIIENFVIGGFYRKCDNKISLSYEILKNGPKAKK
jgi:hypothetical protein